MGKNEDKFKVYRDLKLTTYNRSANDGKNNFFTVIDSRLVKSKEISASAKAIMMYILSQDDSFIVIKENVKKDLGFGVKAFKNAWNELVNNGYIVDNGQATYNGKFIGKYFIINEHPENMTENNNAPKDNGEGASTVAKSEETARSNFADNGISADTNSFIDKVSSNQDQTNQHQFNQDQRNQFTNGADISARSNANDVNVPSSPGDSDGGEVPIENVDYIVQQQTSFHEIPQIQVTQLDETLLYNLQPYLNDNLVMKICHLYSYLVWKNIHFFGHSDAKFWKMNERDYECLNAFLEGQVSCGFDHLIYIADSIFEKAKKAGEVKYVSAAYLSARV